MDPEISGQWAVVDRWWTSEPEQRIFVAIVVDEKECVLLYEKKTATFSIWKEKN
jgi:hypothetical protein